MWSQISKPLINECSFINPILYIQAFTCANINKCPVKKSIKDSYQTKYKWHQSSTNLLLKFHLDHLVRLRKDKPDVMQSVTLSQHVLKIINAGADPKKDDGE